MFSECNDASQLVKLLLSRALALLGHFRVADRAVEGQRCASICIVARGRGEYARLEASGDMSSLAGVVGALFSRLVSGRTAAVFPLLSVEGLVAPQLFQDLLRMLLGCLARVCIECLAGRQRQARHRLISSRTYWRY